MTDYMERAREIAEGVHDDWCGEIEAHNDWIEAYAKGFATALRRVEEETLERCAKVAESSREAHKDCGHHTEYFDGREDAAVAIRALGKEEVG